MRNIRLHHIINDYQYSQDEKKMERTPFKTFIHSLIREYATHNNDSYSLFPCEIEDADRRIFLSYLCSAEDYEDFCSNPTRLKAAFDEFYDEMKYFIDQEIDEVYHSDMRECGHYLSRDYANGDYNVRGF